jgi:hypothetical protein
VIIVVEEVTGYIGFGAVFDFRQLPQRYIVTFCGVVCFLENRLTCKCLATASSVLLVPNYAYVVIRHKMAESVNSLVGTTLLCHYGETSDILPIGGLVQPGETLTTATIRHCRHLDNFRIEQNDRLYTA